MEQLNLEDFPFLAQEHRKKFRLLIKNLREYDANFSNQQIENCCDLTGFQFSEEHNFKVKFFFVGFFVEKNFV